MPKLNKSEKKMAAGFMKKATMKDSQDRLMMLAGGFMPAKILTTANELGIFRYIGDKSRTAADIARNLKLDPEATGLLMGALVGLKLVSYRAGRFANAPDVKKHLGTETDFGLGAITNHLNHMYESWQDLDGIVRKGRPKKRPPSRTMTDKKRNRDFIRGMFEIGHETARMLADALDLEGVMKMADIGCGPAQYPLAFSKVNKKTKFVLADYPNTLRVAREYVKKYGLTKRVKLAGCEFFGVKDLGIGNDFDMVLLSQVLHAASDKACMELIQKCHGILRPGGRIVINENALEDNKMQSPAPPLVFAINMLVNTDGRTFTPSEMSGWLKKAGFKNIKKIRLHDRSVVLEAHK